MSSRSERNAIRLHEYTYALRGHGQPITKIVPGAEQRRALQALLSTINPTTLTLPDRILNLIPPRPPGYPRTQETFPSRTGVTFDPIAAAEAAADMTVSLILNPQRAERLEQYHAENHDNPGLQEVIGNLLDATWRGRRGTYAGLDSRVAATVKNVVLVQLVALAADSSAAEDVRSIAGAEVEKLKNSTASPFQAQLIEALRRDPKSVQLPKLTEAPPGQPLGDGQEVWPFTASSSRPQ